MKMKFNIFTKLFCSFFIIALLGVAVGFIALTDNMRVVSSFTASGERHFRSIVTALTETSSYSKRAEGHLMIYLSLHDAADKKKFYSRCASLQEQLVIISEKAQNFKVRSKLAEIKPLVDQVQPLGTLLIEAHDRDMAGTGKFVIEKYAESILKLFETTSRIREFSMTLAKYELELADNDKLNAINEAKFLRDKLILFGLLSFMAALLFSYLIARTIARPLAELKNMAGVIGSGDLGVRTAIQSNDEIGALASAFNYMAGNLQTSNQKLQQSEAKYSSYVENAPDGIFVIDEKGYLLELNRAACLMGGYTREELLNTCIIDILPEDSLEIACTYFKAMSEKVSSNIEGQFKHKDGSIRWVSVGTVKLAESRFLGFIKDITERKLAENKVKALLAEKEIVLREVHHRIKNNMNTVVGIMSLQLDTLSEPSAIAAISDAKSRVLSMMILYDKLYRSSGFKELSFREYASPLVDEIIGNFPNKAIVKIEKSVDDFMIPVGMLSTLGIIINEILTNIMKYAFAGRDNGLITVFVTNLNKRITIAIGDNGIGIPESIDIANSSGFGLQLISMITDTLNGTIKIERDNGTKFILEFNL